MPLLLAEREGGAGSGGVARGVAGRTELGGVGAVRRSKVLMGTSRSFKVVMSCDSCVHRAYTPKHARS